MQEYDVIVVGAGNAGMMAAATTASRGYKTLLLERHNIPGGSASSFRRGRFEFDPSLHEMDGVGGDDNRGYIRKRLESFGVDINWQTEDYIYRTIAPGPDGFDAKMPVGIKAFCDEMERIVPGSRESVEKVFELAQKGAAAVKYISSGKPDPKVMMTEHADFMRMAAYTLDEGLEALNMPKKARDILSVYWYYMGAPGKMIDFFLFAQMLSLYVVYPPTLPEMRSHEISLGLIKSIKENGGDVWFNSEVEKILVKDGAVYGVVVDGTEYHAKHVICNAFPNAVFSHMIPESEIPEIEVKRANAREIGLSFVTMYLGLNRSAEELGIKDYSIFMLSDPDSNKQYNDCWGLWSQENLIVNCLNIAVPGCSPEGTSMLYFTSTVYGDAWGKVKPEDYKRTKNEIAERMIEVYERRTGIKISPYIEEISVSTPATLSRYLNTPMGTPYGYQINMWDSIMPRSMAMSKEVSIKGLRFCGAHAERCDGYSSTYVSGGTAGALTVKDLEKEKADE